MILLKPEWCYQTWNHMYRPVLNCRHHHYLFHDQTFRRNGFPTALDEIPAIIGLSNRRGRFPSLRSRMIWKSSVPWKGTVSKNVCDSWACSIWRKIKRGWDAPSNKGNQKHKHQFSLFCFYAAPRDLYSILRSQIDRTLCIYQIALVQRNLKKELL